MTHLEGSGRHDSHEIMIRVNLLFLALINKKAILVQPVKSIT
jgi:hypothetical protein